MSILFPPSDIGLHYTKYSLMIKISSDPHLLKVCKDNLFFNVLEVALYFPRFLALNPPRGT